jgi:hypothetical protein
MLSIAVTYTVMLLTLIAVAAYAIIKSRKMDVNSLNNFLRYAVDVVISRTQYLHCLIMYLVQRIRKVH